MTYSTAHKHRMHTGWKDLYFLVILTNVPILISTQLSTFDSELIITAYNDQSPSFSSLFPIVTVVQIVNSDIVLSVIKVIVFLPLLIKLFIHQAPHRNTKRNTKMRNECATNFDIPDDSRMTLVSE